jgi:hypothetical protein
LHAVPESTDHKGKVTRWPHDRQTQFKIEGRDPPWPDLDPACYYLLEAFTELRFCRFNDGMRIIDWHEIEAFAVATRMVSEPWEKKLLAAMSREYINGNMEGKEVLSIPPSEREDG